MAPSLLIPSTPAPDRPCVLKNPSEDYLVLAAKTEAPLWKWLKWKQSFIHTIQLQDD